MGLYFGQTAHWWGVVGALVAPFFWWFMWKWRGRKWFARGYKKIFEGSEEHDEILDIQAKYLGHLFNYIMWILIILLDMNMMGILRGNTTTSRNIYITGGTVTAGVLLGGGTYFSFLMAGVRLLLERGYGIGNYVEVFHPHEDDFSGWVEELGLFTTKFRSWPKFGRHNVRNSLLLEYRTHNLDSGPFYHEIFDFKVTSESKPLVIGKPPKLDPKTRNVIEPGRDSVVIQKLRKELGGYLINTDAKDRTAFDVIFRNMDDNTWAWLSQPSIMLENDHAILRVPVRSFKNGLILRHQISEKNILEVTPNVGTGNS